jgi:cyclopropane fatty-acyl-phospholipid synthase-like methyltransferase
MAKNWVEYWNRRDAMTGELWRAQSAFFVRQIRREMAFGPEDVLLDIGCGNGHVAAALSALVREAHGADTSEISVRTASERYAHIPHLRFHALDPSDYLAVDSLPLRGATRILCVSVVQYYKNLDELAALIARAKKIAAPGCLMLVADLLTDYNLAKDIAGVLLGGFRSGTFFAKLREAVSGNHSLYARIRAENPVLTMTREDVEKICAAENVSLRFLSRDLTGNAFRSHALIGFAPAAAENAP